ncbi:hypothetical protein HJC23_009914 [Cyclotella cryptica]|uniref:Uncharacterized protein n=1 Tax=Cyclotella cryptica TaxID=29204 RepID=A0ABD3NV03_9STRA|eukprot:CCRYP_020033-RA/>CCRYP_020033-RA protein AED:0.22 eAED:0.22 QI:0/-1/0/1/-1/1/1/0/235
MMPPKSANRLTSTTIRRVLADEELSQIFDATVKEAGVHTSIGYHAVLRQFVASEAVLSKVKQWEEEEAEDADTYSTSAASKLCDLTSSFTTKLALDEERADPNMTSPLTTKTMVSDYGSPSPRSANTTFSPSRTFPSVPYSSRSDGFVESPTFRKHFVDFLGSHPKNPFNLNLKDETIVAKKHIPKCQRNLKSLRRSSKVHADEAARLQRLDDDLSPNVTSESEVVGAKMSFDDF